MTLYIYRFAPTDTAFHYTDTASIIVGHYVVLSQSPVNFHL